MAHDSSEALYPRYLELLDIKPDQPNLDFLRRIVGSHLERIPFENISKLWYLKKLGLRGVPDLGLYLDGIERYNFGGTCYSNNVYLNGLLRHLGFEVDLCGADMSEPDVHIVNLARVDGREYLVDVGYAAPFSGPIPRDGATDQIMAIGNESWIVKPTDDKGRTVVEHHREGKRIHGYTARPNPRNPQHFNQAVLDSFRHDSTFMNTIRLVRYSNGWCTAVSGDVLYRAKGEDFSLQRIADRMELSELIQRHFGIPAKIAHEGIETRWNLQLDPNVFVTERRRSF